MGEVLLYENAFISEPQREEEVRQAIFTRQSLARRLTSVTMFAAECEGIVSCLPTSLKPISISLLNHLLAIYGVHSVDFEGLVGSKFRA